MDVTAVERGIVGLQKVVWRLVDRRHRRVSITVGTRALVEARINCWYSGMAEGRIGRATAAPPVMLEVGVSVGMGVG